MKKVISANNQVIRSLKKLKEKKYRDVENAYLIEGLNLFEEALKTGCDILTICINSSLKDRESFDMLLSDRLKAKTIIVPDPIFGELTETVNPQGIIVAVRKKEHQQNDNKSRFVVLDRLQDPGNVGTVIRTAEAAGFGSIIAVKGTADIYSSKVIRAAAGSLFRINILEAPDSIWVFDYLKNIDVTLYACDGNGEIEYYNADLQANIGIVVGNEGNGISSFFLDKCKTISIPMNDDAESLNVAVAAGIVIYESVRQNGL